MIPFTAAFAFFDRQAVMLFLDSQSDQALQVGRSFLRMVAPFYLIIAVKLMADGVLRGAGAMKSFMAATFTDLVLRVVLAYVLSAFMGTDGIWLSWPIGWVTAAILSTLFYFTGVWNPQKARARSN